MDRRHSGGGYRPQRQYKAKFPPRQREPPPEPPESILASLLFQIGDDTNESSMEV